MEIWFIFGQLPFWPGILVFFAGCLLEEDSSRVHLFPCESLLAVCFWCFHSQSALFLHCLCSLASQTHKSNWLNYSWSQPILTPFMSRDRQHLMSSAHVLDANTKQTNMKTSQLPVSREKCNPFLVENKSRVLVAPPIPLQHSFPAEVGKNKLQMTY